MTAHKIEEVKEDFSIYSHRVLDWAVSNLPVLLISAVLLVVIFSLVGAMNSCHELMRPAY